MQSYKEIMHMSESYKNIFFLYFENRTSKFKLRQLLSRCLRKRHSKGLMVISHGSISILRKYKDHLGSRI